MIDQPKKPKPTPLPRPWRRACEQLDHALNQNAPHDFSDKIQIFGKQLFGDLWDLPSRPDTKLNHDR